MMNMLTPHASAGSHWSMALCGLPWEPGAEGPESYDCWGLVRHVQRTQWGREMRALSIAERNAGPGQWTAIRDMVQRGAWRQVATQPADGDIMLMLNSAGLPHVGVVISMPRLYLLHSVGGVGADGKAFGSVQVAPLAELGASGFGHLQCWRAVR